MPDIIDLTHSDDDDNKIPILNERIAGVGSRAHRRMPCVLEQKTPALTATASMWQASYNDNGNNIPLLSERVPGVRSLASRPVPTALAQETPALTATAPAQPEIFLPRPWNPLEDQRARAPQLPAQTISTAIMAPTYAQFPPPQTHKRTLIADHHDRQKKRPAVSAQAARESQPATNVPGKQLQIRDRAIH